jgi:hypothetical protein
MDLRKSAMLKKLMPLLLILSLFLTASLPAQTLNQSLQVNNMEIDIWPEYDQPSTLVIYRVSFASLMSFPARVSFKIPISAGDPYSVAMKDLDGLLYDLEYSVIPDGSWNRIEFVTSTPDVQIEFYDPYSPGANGAHTYSFRWVSDYPVSDLKIVVQQPKYAKDMMIQPDLGTGVINNDDGLTYYTADVGSIHQAESINIFLAYNKINDQLSASTLPVRAAASLPQANNLWQMLRELITPVWENHSLVTAGGLLFAGILLLAFGWLLSTRNKTPRPNLTGEEESKSDKESESNESDTAEVYCHVCGKRAHPDDVYCRACGSKLIKR